MLLAVAGDDADRAYPDLGDPPDIGHAAQRRNAHRGGVADDEHVARLDRAVHQQDDPRDQIADRLLQPETDGERSEEHTSELQSLMRISYAVFCLKKKKKI